MERLLFGLFLVVSFGIIGAANNQREWLGGLVGCLIGLFFACLVNGLLPKKLVDCLFPNRKETKS